MGSIASITIDGYEIESTKNYLNEWFFRKADRKIVKAFLSQRNPMVWGEFDCDETDREEDWYLYETKASTLKRRLELAGWTRQTMEDEFKRGIANRLEHAMERENRDIPRIKEHIETLRAADLNAWLLKLKEVVRHKSKIDPWEDHPQADPILDILLNNPLYQQFSDHIMVFSANWPCEFLEGFARAVLEVVPDDSACVLDATDLVLGGWTDEFSDLEEYQQDFTNFFKVFTKSLNEIDALLPLAPSNQTLLKLLYANVITTMETYLADTLRKQVADRPVILRRFVESDSEFAKAGLKKSQLFAAFDGIKKEAIDSLNEISFHNLAKVIGMYRHVLDVNFPEDKKDALGRCIGIRHDIIHRNGKTSSGSDISLSAQHVTELVALVREVITGIDQQVKDGLLDEIELDSA